MLSHATWQGIGHQLGELWDLKKNASVAEQVAGDDELIRDFEAMTMAPIWTIGINHYVCLPLHMVLGMGSTILSDFIGWIDK
jgi:hypothetical protein